MNIYKYTKKDMTNKAASQKIINKLKHIRLYIITLKYFPNVFGH
jgi:hypothetical protein